MTGPDLCDYHRGQFARLDRARKRRVRHPGDGRKALAERAATIGRQCPHCRDAA